MCIDTYSYLCEIYGQLIEWQKVTTFLYQFSFDSSDLPNTMNIVEPRKGNYLKQLEKISSCLFIRFLILSSNDNQLIVFSFVSNYDQI